MTRQALIIDCDPGVDDAVALMLAFGSAAFDLLAVDRPDDHAQFYGTLCAMQSRAGQGSAMGLGAYFDGSDPFYNPNARFHIDGAGFRSWGRSYTAATSPCP